MIDKTSDEWKIAANEPGHTVSLAIDKFKKAIGCARCSIETTDYEYNASTGGRVKNGPKIGINIYATDLSDDDDDFGDDYDDE